jgi:AcrR family transcriptional regulator
MEKRRYVQRTRAASAEETRRRILDVAREMLAREPAQSLSMDRLANEAGVARSTVYVAFGSRTGLFDALARYLLDRARFDRLVEAVQHPDAREALVMSLREGARLYASDRDAARTLFSLSLLDPDAAGAIAILEHGRAPGMRALAERLAEQGHLRGDVGVAEAADILWVVTGFDTFDQLYAGRGLPVAAVAERLTAIAERSLLADRAPAQPASRSRRRSADRTT